MDVLLFKYYASKHGDTMRDVAKAIRVSAATVSNRLTKKRGDFTRSDIQTLKERWKLTPEQVDKIFLQADTEL